MKAVPSAEALLQPLREAWKELPRESLPALVSELARLQAEILLSREPEAPKGNGGDRLLSPAEVALMIGRSADWCYRNRHSLPATRLPSGRWAVQESRLKRWIESRAAGNR